MEIVGIVHLFIEKDNFESPYLTYLCNRKAI